MTLGIVLTLIGLVLTWLVATMTLVFRTGKLVNNLEKVVSDLMALDDKVSKQTEWSWHQDAAMKERLARCEARIDAMRRNGPAA